LKFFQKILSESVDMSYVSSVRQGRFFGVCVAKEKKVVQIDFVKNFIQNL
jgi:hypothetical protein